MPIDTSKLVQSKVLQDYLVDKSTGEALTAGVITCYRDNSRNTLKNWYYQSGSYPNYTYITLPNPLTLSAVGTIVDENGNDTLPLFYPFSETDNSTREPYYITVVNSTGTAQFVRQNFPYEPNTSGPITENNPTLKNLIINNRFWRAGNGTSSTTVNSAGVVTVTLTNETDIDVCPSQHDGFSMPDIRFLKSTGGATESAVFQKFTAGSSSFANAVRPEFYLNHVCTGIGAETYKKYQFPISLHIASLDGVDAIANVWLKVNNGSANGSVTAKILQYTGSGTGNTASYELPLDTYTASPTWTASQSKFTFPTTLGKTYDAGQIQDSAFYLELYLQPNVALDISIAIPSTYLGDTVPTTDFSSYDEIDSIINSPRTGDFRHTLNRSQPGWVPANDGTIGSSASGATTRANPDTWPLYDLMWTNVLDTWAPVSTGRGASSSADFSANKTITLTKNLGRVLSGLNPLLTSTVFTAAISALTFTGALATDLLTFASHTFSTGTPFQVTTSGGGVLPSPLAASTTYYAIFQSATTIKVATSLKNAIAGTAIDLTTDSVATCSFVNTNNVLTLTTSQSPVLIAGTPIQLANSGGGLPSGLSASTVYYISTTGLSATTVMLSDNLTDALAGYFIGFQTNGTGTNTMYTALGAYNGASYTTDVAAHTHPFTSDNTFYKATGGSTIGTGNTDQETAFVSGTTDSTGVNELSLIQPSAYTNVFLKL